MLKLLALFAFATGIAARPGEMRDIPGVSAANMERLRQMMNPRPNGREEFKQRMQEWENSLPAAERTAVQNHRRQMFERRHAELLQRGIPGVSDSSMDRLRQMMNPLPEGREAFQQKMDEWINSLPPADKAAAEAHREQMRQRHRGPPPPPPL
ncbi:unnamed protein product [Cylicocyclus nassatus]|uniref:DUF3106 domain-containing protein n=1 Tax=Cylicocyclus nassatus TaxID=53992 RepID=A0AA36DRY1_CYLNA|nr:unnamed protein product [Cylicocyclus nassatus]